ncbi:MAG: hypothetical protein FWC59_00280, partial [Actinomycetia bacterium]|nr:hypothetical protein [Actinomycetes bacterium]
MPVPAPQRRQRPSRSAAAAAHQLVHPFWRRNISRRAFLASSLQAGAAVALGTAAAGSLAGCSDNNATASSGSQVTLSDGTSVAILSARTDQLLEVTEFNEATNLADYLVEAVRYELPYGTIFYQMDNDRVLALIPSGSGRSLIRFEQLDLNNGTRIRLLDTAVGLSAERPAAILYDARCSTDLLLWTECDVSDLSWQVYTAQLTNGSVGGPVLVDEGSADMEIPLLAVAGDKAYWTVMPNPGGPAQYNDSYLKMAGAGSSDVQIVYTSHGRMCTTPLVDQGVLTFVPRVDTKNIYYQLTALDTASNQIQYAAVMPQSVRVLDALALEGNFCFSLEDNYSYASGLGFYGTYQPLANADRWLHLARKPSAAPVILRDRLVVKSALRVIGIDAANQFYYSIPPLSGSADYGDILAGWGHQERLVIYSNVNTGLNLDTAKGILRVFTPV